MKIPFIWDKVHNIGPEDDTKIQRLKSLLAGELKGEKVIIFSYYKDTRMISGRGLI